MEQIDDCFWTGGPRPGARYAFPGTFSVGTEAPMKRTTQPMVTGSSVLGVKYDGGVMIASDTLGSYGSLARFTNISRMVRINDKTVIAADGDYADFQFLKSIIEQKVISDECAADGVQYTPSALHSWLTRVLYNRRSRFNPLWNNIIVAGLDNDDAQPFLGFVNKIGTAYEAPSLSTGYGMYMAQPLLREALEKNPLPTEKEARSILHHCMTVLYYRDARSWNRYELAVVGKGKPAVIEGPIQVTGEWNLASMVKGYE